MGISSNVLERRTCALMSSVSSSQTNKQNKKVGQTETAGHSRKKLDKQKVGQTETSKCSKAFCCWSLLWVFCLLRSMASILVTPLTQELRADQTVHAPPNSDNHFVQMTRILHFHAQESIVPTFASTLSRESTK